MSTLYYYELSDGSMNGPVELDDLLRDEADGMLTSETRLSRGGDDPWVSLREVKLRDLHEARTQEKEKMEANRVAGESKPVKLQRDAPFEEAMAKFERDKHSEKNEAESTGTLLESSLYVVGALVIIGSLLLMGIAIVGELEDGATGFAIAVTSLLSGMLFLAVSKALGYLREIAQSIKNSSPR